LVNTHDLAFMSLVLGCDVMQPHINLRNMDITYKLELLVQLLSPELSKVFHVIKLLNEVMSPYMI
jgi:hypothetical protein